jgi:hypothetical protein
MGRGAKGGGHDTAPSERQICSLKRYPGYRLCLISKASCFRIKVRLRHCLGTNRLADVHRLPLMRLGVRGRQILMIPVSK